MLAAAAKLLQLCPTLCGPIEGSPPGSPVPEILQARTLEWVAISFSNAWKGKVKVKSLSRVRLFSTPWTSAYQSPPSMGFSRQEYWSGMPLPSPLWCLAFFIVQLSHPYMTTGKTIALTGWTFFGNMICVHLCICYTSIKCYKVWRKWMQPWRHFQYNKARIVNQPWRKSLQT